jgi:hypothetical protein
MEKLGFMHEIITTHDKYDISYGCNGSEWDRQTVVILCGSSQISCKMRSYVGRRKSPSSHSYGNGYQIDIFTNLNYSKNEKDPAMRNIRIVYCDMSIMNMREVNSRFPNSYIIIMRDKGDELINGNDTRRIGREIPQISCN